VFQRKIDELQELPVLAPIICFAAELDVLPVASNYRLLCMLPVKAALLAINRSAQADASSPLGEAGMVWAVVIADGLAIGNEAVVLIYGAPKR
jgi:hypothetical protein